MTRQKPISLKIDEDLLNKLEIEGQRKKKSRNTLINIAVHNFLDQDEIRRRFVSADDDDEKKQLFALYLLEHFPEAYFQIMAVH